MKKIYIVHSRFEHYNYTKVFSTLEKAEKYKEKATRVFTLMSEHISTNWHKTETCLDDDGNYIEALEIGTPEYELALDIWDAHTNLEHFKCCVIREFEVH